MNWRGISGIYAGLAVVLGGAWLWVQFASVWALAAIGGGFLLAGASVVHIVNARRGPRPAKAKVPRVWQRKAAPVADDEADAIARARMAAIAGRTTGRAVFAEPESAQQLDEIEPEAGLAEPHVVETTMIEPADDPVGAEQPVADLEPEPDVEAPETVVSEDTLTDVAEADPDPVAAIEDSRADAETSDAAASEYEPSANADVAPDEPEAPAVALDNLPGFPWTARFIGLWAREVRYACPDDLRGAVGHWQRWADAQSAGTPLIEEAADEFKAMLSAWRECGAGVPGLASDDAVARQLAEEAGEDTALAGLLPSVLRVKSKQEA